MKKIFLSFAIGLIAIALNANPIYIPPVYLYKFFFDENQNWEIFMDGWADSLLISSSSGKSICKKFTFGVNTYHPYYPDYGFIIRNDSLNSPVNINPEGDSITIVSYTHNWGRDSETFIYGNFRNSIIPKPLKGQSISAFWTDGMVFYHCLSDSLHNLKGALHGYIYDKNNSLIKKGSIALDPFPIYVSWPCADGSYVLHGLDIYTDGTYSTKLYSQIYKLGTIDICSHTCYYYSIGTAKIAPLNFTIYPDSSVVLDIHLLDSIVDIKKVEANLNELLKVFPNPINEISFHYEISTPVNSTHCIVDLINMNGQEIQRYNIIGNSGELQLPSNISNGTYLLKLLMNDKVYSSVSLVVNRK
jgi:hypothetical protein